MAKDKITTIPDLLDQELVAKNGSIGGTLRDLCQTTANAHPELRKPFAEISKGITRLFNAYNSGDKNELAAAKQGVNLATAQAMGINQAATLESMREAQEVVRAYRKPDKSTSGWTLS